MFAPTCMVALNGCTGELQQYDDMASCMEFMRSVPTIDEQSMHSNSAACRFLHSPLVAFAPEVHCPHKPIQSAAHQSAAQSVQSGAQSAAQSAGHKLPQATATVGAFNAVQAIAAETATLIRSSNQMLSKRDEEEGESVNQVHGESDPVSGYAKQVDGSTPRQLSRPSNQKLCQPGAKEEV
eukprot:gene11322-18596_t